MRCGHGFGGWRRITIPLQCIQHVCTWITRAAQATKLSSQNKNLLQFTFIISQPVVMDSQKKVLDPQWSAFFETQLRIFFRRVHFHACNIWHLSHVHKPRERGGGRGRDRKIGREGGRERLRVCLWVWVRAWGGETNWKRKRTRGESNNNRARKMEWGLERDREQQRWNEVWRETENNKDIARHTDR